MKPKNRVMCPDCGRAKMLFETEKEANTFLKFNMESVNPNGDRTMRAYYCPACCGWHISSHEYKGNNDRTDKLIKAYHRDLEMKGQLPKTKVEISEEEINKVFQELVENGFQTRVEVNAFLRTKEDVSDRVKQEDRLRYYKKYNTPKYIPETWSTK